MRRRGLGVAGAALCLALAGCGGGAARPASSDRLQVVTTTPVLADLVRHVTGGAADVASLVPATGDPHSYEPSLRDVRTVVYADVAFSNYLMLEGHSVIKTLDANLRPGTPSVALAEASTKYGAEVIPLVENANLDTLWLGLRVQGSGASRGATRASEVEVSATGMKGPGALAAYLTETFGRPHVFTDSADGFDPGDGYEHDTLSLPTDAHTHMSWAFSAPGVYRLDVRSVLRTSPGAPAQAVGSGTVTFVVGLDPAATPEAHGKTWLAAGHADLSTDLDTGRLQLLATGEKGTSTPVVHPLESTVVVVPGKALTEVPPQPEFRFLGRPGAQVYQLPQAVLGAHVHGEIDPHLWLSVKNTKAYVRTIADTLAHADPARETTYRANARAYEEELTALDREIAAQLETIPPGRRHLVTTHDAYAYLARSYGLEVAGFVTPNPGVEPSLPQRRKLVATIRSLRVPAVFLEPNLARRSAVLRTIADEAGARVCTIRSDSFDADVHTYTELMRANAAELVRCLR